MRIIIGCRKKIRQGSWTKRIESCNKNIWKKRLPSSFFPKPSNCTPSLNLYVSQHTTTGTPCCFAIIATKAVPALENTAPLECKECAPRKTVVTSVMTEGRAGRRRYVQGIWVLASYGDAVSVRRSALPSRRGRESTMITENRLPDACAATMTFSTTDDLWR